MTGHDPDATTAPGNGATGLALTVTWHENLVVLGVGGTLDMVTAPQLTDTIQTTLTNDPAAVIIDLTDVAFLASAGMTVLIATHKQIADSTQFAVVADGPAVGRPLHLVGVDKLLTIHTTLDAALQATAKT